MTNKNASMTGRLADGVHVRHATPDDTPAILTLVRSTLGEGNIPRETSYWNWKHERNPFGPSPILLAVADRDIVGLRAFMRWSWTTDGRVIAAVRAVDTATRRDWQGKGLFRYLTLALANEMQSGGASFVYNTPNKMSRPGYLKMGWTSVGRTDLWLRLLRPTHTVSSLGLLGRRRSSSPAAMPSTQYPLAREYCAGPEFDRMAGMVPQSALARLSTPYSADYLRWRYGAVPQMDYYVLTDAVADSSALVFFRFKPHGPLLELRVCDILLGSGARSKRIAADLLRQLCSDGNADYLSAMAASGTPAHAALWRAGFIPVPRVGPVLTVRPLVDSPHPDPRSRSSWAASVGDLELF